MIFLWAFFDKVFGLGFATKPEQAWLHGGSPAGGFLGHAVHGPFINFYHTLAGNPVVDWLFMLGLLGLGISLILGIALTLTACTGSLMMILMWSALLPPANHPFLDEHIIYALLLFAFAWDNAGDHLGFGRWWAQTELVKKNPLLR